MKEIHHKTNKEVCKEDERTIIIDDGCERTLFQVPKESSGRNSGSTAPYLDDTTKEQYYNRNHEKQNEINLGYHTIQSFVKHANKTHSSMCISNVGHDNNNNNYNINNNNNNINNNNNNEQENAFYKNNLRGSTCWNKKDHTSPSSENLVSESSEDCVVDILHHNILEMDGTNFLSLKKVNSIDPNEKYKELINNKTNKRYEENNVTDAIIKLILERKTQVTHTPNLYHHNVESLINRKFERNEYYPFYDSELKCTKRDPANYVPMSVKEYLDALYAFRNLSDLNSLKLYNERATRNHIYINNNAQSTSSSSIVNGILLDHMNFETPRNSVDECKKGVPHIALSSTAEGYQGNCSMQEELLLRNNAKNLCVSNTQNNIIKDHQLIQDKPIHYAPNSTEEYLKMLIGSRDKYDKVNNLFFAQEEGRTKDFNLIQRNAINEKEIIEIKESTFIGHKDNNNIICNNTPIPQYMVQHNPSNSSNNSSSSNAPVIFNHAQVNQNTIHPLMYNKTVRIQENFWNNGSYVKQNVQLVNEMNMLKNQINTYNENMNILHCNKNRDIRGIITSFNDFKGINFTHPDRQVQNMNFLKSNIKFQNVCESSETYQKNNESQEIIVIEDYNESEKMCAKKSVDSKKSTNDTLTTYNSIRQHPVSTRSDSARYNSARYDSASYNSARYNTAINLMKYAHKESYNEEPCTQKAYNLMNQMYTEQYVNPLFAQQHLLKMNNMNRNQEEIKLRQQEDSLNQIYKKLCTNLRQSNYPISSHLNSNLYHSSKDAMFNLSTSNFPILKFCNSNLDNSKVPFLNTHVPFSNSHMPNSQILLNQIKAVTQSQIQRSNNSEDRAHVINGVEYIPRNQTRPTYIYPMQSSEQVDHMNVQLKIPNQRNHHILANAYKMETKDNHNAYETNKETWELFQKSFADAKKFVLSQNYQNHPIVKSIGSSKNYPRETSNELKKNEQMVKSIIDSDQFLRKREDIAYNMPTCFESNKKQKIGALIKVQNENNRIGPNNSYNRSILIEQEKESKETLVENKTYNHCNNYQAKVKTNNNVYMEIRSTGESKLVEKQKEETKDLMVITINEDEEKKEEEEEEKKQKKEKKETKEEIIERYFKIEEKDEELNIMENKYNNLKYEEKREYYGKYKKEKQEDVCEHKYKEIEEVTKGNENKKEEKEKKDGKEKNVPVGNMYEQIRKILEVEGCNIEKDTQVPLFKNAFNLNRIDSEKNEQKEGPYENSYTVTNKYGSDINKLYFNGSYTYNSSSNEQSDVDTVNSSKEKSAVCIEHCVKETNKNVPCKMNSSLLEYRQSITPFIRKLRFRKPLLHISGVHKNKKNQYRDKDCDRLFDSWLRIQKRQILIKGISQNKCNEKVSNLEIKEMLKFFNIQGADMSEIKFNEHHERLKFDQRRIQIEKLKLKNKYRVSPINKMLQSDKENYSKQHMTLCTHIMRDPRMISRRNSGKLRSFEEKSYPQLVYKVENYDRKNKGKNNNLIIEPMEVNEPVPTSNPLLFTDNESTQDKLPDQTNHDSINGPLEIVSDNFNKHVSGYVGEKKEYDNTKNIFNIFVLYEQCKNLMEYKKCSTEEKITKYKKLGFIDNFSLDVKFLTEEQKKSVRKLYRKIRTNKEITKKNLLFLSQMLHYKFVQTELNLTGNYDPERNRIIDIQTEKKKSILKNKIPSFCCSCVDVPLTFFEQEFLEEFQFYVPFVNLSKTKEVRYILRHALHSDECAYGLFLSNLIL